MTEEGSASIWLLGLTAPLLAVCVASVLDEQVAALRHRAEGFADRAALAGAGHEGPTACAWAAMTVTMPTTRTNHGVRLHSCAVSDGVVRVEVRVVARLPIVGEVTVAAAAAARPMGPADIPLPEVP